MQRSVCAYRVDQFRHLLMGHVGVLTGSIIKLPISLQLFLDHRRTIETIAELFRRHVPGYLIETLVNTVAEQLCSLG